MYCLRILGNVVATYVWQRTACVCFETYWLRMLGKVLATMLGNKTLHGAMWSCRLLRLYSVGYRRNE